MKKVLFICEGNMIRSQMAEAFYNNFTNSNSAGSAGVTAAVGSRVSDLVSEAMSEKGVSMKSHTSKQLTQEMFDEADIVVAFPTPYMPKSVIKDSKTIHWDVSDPFYMSGNQSDFIERARDRIEQKVRELINNENRD